MSINPMGPPGVYLADPAARVMPDGRLYVYGSVDEYPDRYCSQRYHVLSTEDLESWQLHENIFASAGSADAVPYSDSMLYAPDCIYKDGKYYLYYCQPDRKAHQGVAIGDSPTGPFRDAQPFQLGKWDQIDSAVFIDDDGRAYYTWGQFTAKIARLKPGMTEIDPSTIVENLLTEAEHYFHEGGFLTKRKGLYYYLYSHMGRANTPTGLGYATSDQPTGPYKYRGVIIDNRGSDPAVWNNHGSIAEFKGQWYVLYHRPTHDSGMMRRTCIELITFNDDGSIDEVEMTTQGAGRPLDPTRRIQAQWACLLGGNGHIEERQDKHMVLANMQAGDRAGFKYLNFDRQLEAVEVRLRKLKENGTLDILIDQPWGPAIARLSLPSAPSGEWTTLSVQLKQQPKGQHALWLNPRDDSKIEIDWLRFK